MYIFDSWVLAMNYATHTPGHHTLKTYAVTANFHYWRVS